MAAKRPPRGRLDRTTTPLFEALVVHQPLLISRAKAVSLLALGPALLSLGSPTVHAQQAGRLNPAVFPPSQLFREIQLETMACGRENSAAACDKARALADPLMDHPLLSAACKDTAWSIRERAVVATKNSYARREALNSNASELVARCKPATKPLGTGDQSSKDEPKKSGGLGGFLKGLGIGGGTSK